MKKTSTCKGSTETSVKHQISDFNPALFKCHNRVAPESFYCNRTHRDLEHAELVSSQPCGSAVMPLNFTAWRCCKPATTAQLAAGQSHRGQLITAAEEVYGSS